MKTLKPFTKEYQTAAELVELLKSRGLAIADEQKAKANIAALAIIMTRLLGL